MWHEPNREFKEQNLAPTMQHSSGSIIVWGYFAASSTGNLAHTPGIMDFTVYQAIWQKTNIEMSENFSSGGNRQWKSQ